VAEGYPESVWGEVGECDEGDACVYFEGGERVGASFVEIAVVPVLFDLIISFITLCFYILPATVYQMCFSATLSHYKSLV
jgi:hypothetical protein